jgi:hypothetical protein
MPRILVPALETKEIKLVLEDVEVLIERDVPPPPPEGGGTEAPPAEAGVTPESRMDSLNILVENNLIEGNLFLDLGQGQDSLGEISKELDKLLNS